MPTHSRLEVCRIATSPPRQAVAEQDQTVAALSGM